MNTHVLQPRGDTKSSRASEEGVRAHHSARAHMIISWIRAVNLNLHSDLDTALGTLSGVL